MAWFLDTGRKSVLQTFPRWSVGTIGTFTAPPWKAALPTKFLAVEPERDESASGERTKGVEAVVAGRTYYGVSVGKDRSLVFTPKRNIDLWFENDPENSRDKEDEVGQKQAVESGLSGATPAFTKKPARFGQGESLSDWALGRIVPVSGSFLSAVAVCFLAAIFSKRGDRRKKTSAAAFFATVFPATASVFLLPPLWNGCLKLDLAHLLFLAWSGWAWSALLFAVKGARHEIAGRLLCVAYFLAGFGTLVLLQLAAGADNTRWLDPVRKRALVLMPAGFLVAVAAVSMAGNLRDLWNSFSAEERGGWHALRIGLLVLGTSLVVAQVFFGTERGLMGIQYRKQVSHSASDGPGRFRPAPPPWE